ncbi:hypothetical protein FHR92_000276 [Fontibacillus solani]|uniref:Peptidase A2 domain-containing protein n=1 Tax=Fontibacillus solani TaxID=1572857 RepID=A0A7W3SPH0_9BACL|nr:hypothetical protein [Fontibacillus solani]MBA9083833.1 hypothetical protein [Fontibacillus solani]
MWGSESLDEYNRNLWTSFVSMTVMFRGRELKLEKVLLNTGSASTLLNADIVQEIDMVPERNDFVDIIRGVGSVECAH